MNLSQAAFGEKIGRAQSVVSKYEKGRVQPPAWLVMDCMKILGGGRTSEGEVSSIEVARLVESRLEGPQFSKLRAALADLIESVSVPPGNLKRGEA